MTLPRLLPADPPLDPSGAQGRELLRTELRKLPYGEHRTLLERLQDWIGERVDRAAASGASLFGQILILVAAAAIVAVVAYAATRARRGRLARESAEPEAVLTETGLSAADYRRRAAQAEAAGDHAAATLDWFRALVRTGEERALLDERPGGTAHELAGALGRFFPGDAPALRVAGDVFDGVRYGEQRVDATGSARMRALEERLRHRRPTHTDSPSDDGLVAPGRWAP
ncbi:DUF4129 domain-containing protein [Luteipulveratus flavus]|uniref:DUF4129 domain-containing protein n=1 Tax=Luteipulveratus flavus TaxID=3031728 RepID=A0ABT6C2B2_9MICO|nr:DUF4129 domain-containing protein [Luteipulveratus sp. YIM 133296]MDF8263058.1 DUF4129 domain-containing protein [Luteipulveratus sp. YIM 133296]